MAKMTSQAASMTDSNTVQSVQSVQDELDDLLSRELGQKVQVPSKSTSYGAFRVAYLRAISRLRPKFFENDEDFLDRTMRLAEWGKRQRYNNLKHIWIRYDKIAPDKARNLTTEDQEIENNMDQIEEDIQEEWQEFAEELLDILDFDEEDEDDFGDDEDMDDLAQWRAEMKDMQQDTSLLKRRILERTMQRRAREEEKQKRVAKGEKKTRQEERQRREEEERKRREIEEHARLSMRRYAACEEVVRIRKQKAGENEAEDCTNTILSPLHKGGKKKSNKRDDENYSLHKSMSALSVKDDKRSPIIRTRSQNSYDDKRQNSLHESTTLANKDEKKSSSKSNRSESAETATNHKNLIVPNGIKGANESSSTLSSKSSDPSSQDSKAKLRKSPRRASLDYEAMTSVKVDTPASFSSGTQSAHGGVSRRASMASLKSNTDHVTSLRQVFSQPTAPILPSTSVASKFKYGQTGVRAALMTSGASGSSTEGLVEDSKTAETEGVKKKKGANIRHIIKSLEVYEIVKADELIKTLDDLCHVTDKNEKAQKEFGRGKGNGLLHNIIIHYQTNTSVMESCFCTVLKLTQYETNRDALGLLGMIENVLMGMLYHKDSALLQEWGCDILTAFAVTRKYQDWIVECNGIEVVLTTQSAFKLNAKVQTASFRALKQITLDNREILRHAAASGAITALMGVICMVEHEANVTFHRVALQTISAWAKEDDANRGAVAKHSGVYLILLAMESFADDAELQQYACEALCALATDHRQNRESICQQGGIRILSRTMKEHREHLGVQEGALPLLTQLTDISDVSWLFAEEGGVERVLVAMRNFESSTVHEHGCLTLCNMAIQEENKDIIRNLGGIRMIVSAMRMLGANKYVQKSGCRALDSLATSDQSKVTIAASGGVSAMLSAMKTHIRDAGVQGLAIAALRKLATVARNRGIMQMNEGVESIKDSMQKYPQHKHLQENGHALIKLLDPTGSLFSKVPANEEKDSSGITPAIPERPASANIDTDASTDAKEAANIHVSESEGVDVLDSRNFKAGSGFPPEAAGDTIGVDNEAGIGGSDGITSANDIVHDEICHTTECDAAGTKRNSETPRDEVDGVENDSSGVCVADESETFTVGGDGTGSSNDNHVISECNPDETTTRRKRRRKKKLIEDAPGHRGRSKSFIASETIVPLKQT